MREKFRAWAEILETFFLEVVFEERHDYKAKLTRAILFGGSKCFQVAVKLRLWLYNVRILRDKIFVCHEKSLPTPYTFLIHFCLIVSFSCRQNSFLQYSLC